MANHIAELTDANFQSEVIDSDIPVLVDFWAPWCGPCRALAPHIEALAEDYVDRLKVAKINVDTSPNTAGSFRISSIPTILLFKGGKVVDQIQGLRTKADLAKSVDALL